MLGSFLIVLLPSCAIHKVQPPTQFITPHFNSATVPNSPTYPNNTLSKNAVTVPDHIVSFDTVNYLAVYNIVWYDPGYIGFVGPEHTYRFDIKNKQFEKIQDVKARNNVENSLKNVKIEWTENTTKLRQATEAALDVTKVLLVLASRNVSATQSTHTKTYTGRVTTLDGKISKKVNKKERDSGYGVLTDFFIKDKKLKSQGAKMLWRHPRHLTPDGKYLVIYDGFVNSGTGQTTYSIPFNQGKSLPPVLTDYFYNPDFSKILLLYRTDDMYKTGDGVSPSYAIEIVDYLLPELG